MAKHLDMSVGIYASHATITRHRNGDVTVRYPVVMWCGSTGVLEFRKVYLTGPKARQARRVFDGTEMIQSPIGEYVMGVSEFLSSVQ